MLKRSWSILIVLFVTTVSFSQNQFKPEWHLGIKGGVSASRVFFNPRVEQQFKFGKTFGLAMTYYSDYFWKAKWGLHLELNRTEKGWTSILEEPESYKRGLTYFEMPMMAQCTFGFKHIKVLINFGPFISLLQDELEQTNFDITLETTPYYNERKVETKFDLGVGGGIGLVKPFSWGRVQVEGRVMQSLTGIYEYNEKALGSQNQYGELTFAVFYILNKKN